MFTLAITGWLPIILANKQLPYIFKGLGSYIPFRRLSTSVTINYILQLTLDPLDPPHPLSRKLLTTNDSFKDRQKDTFLFLYIYIDITTYLDCCKILININIISTVAGISHGSFCDRIIEETIKQIEGTLLYKSWRIFLHSTENTYKQKWLTTKLSRPNY